MRGSGRGAALGLAPLAGRDALEHAKKRGDLDVFPRNRHGERRLYHWPVAPASCEGTLRPVRRVTNALGGILAVLVTGGGAVACGGAVDGGPTAASGAGAGTSAGGSTSALPDGGTAAGGQPAGGADSGSPDVPYRDPSCPPAGKVQGPHVCDVGQSLAGCGPGERCVPFVTYGDKCKTETIGTECAPLGTAVQGEDCSVDAACADGFVCVSAGNGFECAQLCTEVGGKSNCPPGLLCAPLDVDGYSVCG